MDKLLDELLKVLTNKDKDIEEMYYELNLDELQRTKKYQTLEECIYTSDKLIIENLKKIYKISDSCAKKEKEEIVKNHKAKKIEKIFNLLEDTDKEILNKTMEMKNIKRTKKNTKLITKMCMLGVCFKIKGKENDDEYHIPQEIKEIWYKVKQDTKKESNINKINNIIRMCGVIKKKELYQIYRQTYDISISREDFDIYAYGLNIINNDFYVNNDCFIKTGITKDKAEKYLKIQEKSQCTLEQMNDRDISDLYNKREILISPIGDELLDYVKTLKTDVEEEFPILITDTLREQLEFDANEILEEVYEFIPALSKATKTKIMEYIIRMYHDTRLYKYKGFKPFEIGAYLTNEEIEKIENDLEIKFDDKDYLRLADIYPDYFFRKFKNIKENEDGTISCRKKVYFTQYNINKSKKFITYLRQKNQVELQGLCEVYCVQKRIRRPANKKEAFIEYIENNKEEIFKYNFATLEEEEFDFINEIVKKGGYIELFEDDIEGELLQVIYELIKKGVIFTRTVKSHTGKVMQIHIPKDTLEIIKNLFNTYDTKKILELRLLLEGISNVYGVIPKTQARKIVSIVKSDFLKYFNEFSAIINYCGDANYCMMITNIIKDEDEILSISDLDIDYMKELLNKKGEYKIYTYTDYIELARGTYERKTSAYKKFQKYMKEYFDVKNSQEIEYLIDDYYFEQQINEYMARKKLNDVLYENFTIAVPNADLIYEKIANMIIDVSDQMPQWNLKGNIKEKNILNIQIEENKERKIGRNELCWCGSGKKYKKCHGRYV